MIIKTKNRPLYKSPIAWLILLLFMVLAFVILEKTNITNIVKTPAEMETAAQQAEQKQTDRATKQEFIEDSPVAIPSNPPQNNDTISLSGMQEGSNVNILTKLKDFSGGLCELTISNGSKMFSTDAEVIYQPEFSSCAGFTVPVSRLGPGQWSITLNATPTGGSLLTKTTSVEVK